LFVLISLDDIERMVRVVALDLNGDDAAFPIIEDDYRGNS
jgi:hypothetical protein